MERKDFEQMLGQCDVDIQYQYAYIQDELDKVCDEQLDVVRQIAENQVEINVNRGYGLIGRMKIVLLKLKNKRLKSKYNRLMIREDYLLDIDDDMYFNIMMDVNE